MTPGPSRRSSMTGLMKSTVPSSSTP